MAQEPKKPSVSLRSASGAPEPSRVESPSAPPMHFRDRRLYVILTWGAIPGALIVGCFIAWGSGQLPWQWAVAGIILGVLGMAVATLYALEKKPPPPRYPGPILIAIAILTWLLIGWQTWLAFHQPMQGYTQAQLDKAVEDGKSPIQSKLDAANRQPQESHEPKPLIAPQAPASARVLPVRPNLGDPAILRNEEVRVAAYVLADQIIDHAVGCTQQSNEIGRNKSISDTERGAREAQLDATCSKDFRTTFLSDLLKIHTELQRRLNLGNKNIEFVSGTISIGSMYSEGTALVDLAKMLP